MNFNASPETGSGDFLKIEPGQKVVGVLRGQPREFYAKFEGGKSTECKSFEPDARFRCRVNFITRSPEGDYTSKVWEFGPTVYLMLKELNQEYNLEERIISIKRNGSGLETTYTILPLDKKVDGALAEQISKVDLKPLVAQQKSDDQQAESFGSFGEPPTMSDSSEELPF